LLERGLFKIFIVYTGDSFVDRKLLGSLALLALQEPHERQGGRYDQKPQQYLFCFRTQFIASKPTFISMGKAVTAVG
jgi:hypothetical protein